MSALAAAILCLVSPLAIPVNGAVPISLATFIIYLTAAIFDRRVTLTSVFVYIALGLTGLPVFSGYVGGIGAVMSPNGGFILGYIPMALALCLLIDHKTSSVIMLAVSMIIATIILYMAGTLWFVLISASDIKIAIMTCILPFLPGDAAKIAISVFISDIMKRRITKI